MVETEDDFTIVGIFGVARQHDKAIHNALINVEYRFKPYLQGKDIF